RAGRRARERLRLRARPGERDRARRAGEAADATAPRDRAPEPMRRAHTPSHPVDEAEQARVDVPPRAPAPAERALRADRAPPASGRDPTRVAVVRKGVQLPAGRAAEDRDQRAL